MGSMIARIKNWFAGLSQREQILVGIFAVLLSFTILIFGIIQPLIGAHVDARKDHAIAVEDSARLSAKIDLLENGEGDAKFSFSGSLHQYLAASAAEKGFEIGRNDALGNNAATITMSAAGPTAFFAWVNELEQKNIRLETLTVSPTPGGAISVNASFVSGS